MRSLKFSLAVSFCLVSVSLCAQTLSVSVVQNEDAPAIAVQMSRVVEDEILGFCFDSGLIASNDEMRFDGLAFANKRFGIKQAAFGMSDYLYAVSLVYGQSEKKLKDSTSSFAELFEIKWRLVRVRDSFIITEKTIKVSSIPVEDSDPYRQTRVITRKITSDCIVEMRSAVAKEKKEK